MTPAKPHICVCICTFRRPDYLRRLLEKVETQRTDDRFTWSIVVVDNDSGGSARAVVDARLRDGCGRIDYRIEARQGIALARNTAMEMAQGDWVAMIDDDEFPVEDWLLSLLAIAEREQADGVLGPVRPHFDSAPPSWVLRGRFFDRPEHTTGTVLEWTQTRSGNALVRLACVKGPGPVFDPKFLTGEDRDFFRRAIERGCRFVWCNEAIVYESVPPERWRRWFMVRRALFRGRMSLNHPGPRLPGVAKSAVAMLAYGVALPFLLLAGHHWFVMYLVKACDHAGKVFAFLGMAPVKGAYVTE